MRNKGRRTEADQYGSQDIIRKELRLETKGIDITAEGKARVLLPSAHEQKTLRISVV